MSGVREKLQLLAADWKRGPLRLSGVPPAGSSLPTAAASPRAHALSSASAVMRVGMSTLRLGSRGEGRFGRCGGGAQGE